MQNTPSQLPITQRPTDELIEDLCLALRDVGVRTWSLPNDDFAVSAVRNVQQIYALLRQRNADIRSRIERLSEETSWQMKTLLEECLAFPEVIPYVKDADGVRRALRCSICQKREHLDREGIWLCDVCLAQAKDSIESLIPMKGLLLLRIYNEENWCKHANSETVLIAFDDYDTLGNIYCNQCFSEEQARRTNIRLSS
ncbi:MAG: hypothetical protein WKF92_09490 [Pyrinomonadaceae bacterium]